MSESHVPWNVIAREKDDGKDGKDKEKDSKEKDKSWLGTLRPKRERKSSIRKGAEVDYEAAALAVQSLLATRHSSQDILTRSHDDHEPAAVSSSAPSVAAAATPASIAAAAAAMVAGAGAGASNSPASEQQFSATPSRRSVNFASMAPPDMTGVPVHRRPMSVYTASPPVAAAAAPESAPTPPRRRPTSTYGAGAVPPPTAPLPPPR